MVRKRLIVVLTINNGVLFRTRDFIPDYRYTMNFVDTWSIDEIIALDITRPGEGDRENFYNVVQDIASKCFVPLAVGGGIRTTDDIKFLLSIGADKVVINTEAVMRPNFINEAAKMFGSQCIVVSIDARKKDSDTYEVCTDFGTRNTGLNPVEWARSAEELGAGEIMITSIDKDGTLEGYDNKLNKIIAEAVNIPVLVCGGAGRWKDFVDGFVDGKASAVCTTNIYHFTEISVRSAKSFISKASVPIRVH